MPEHHCYPERSLGTALRVKGVCGHVVDVRPDRGLLPSGEAGVLRPYGWRQTRPAWEIRHASSTEPRHGTGTVRRKLLKYQYAGPVFPWPSPLGPMLPGAARIQAYAAGPWRDEDTPCHQAGPQLPDAFPSYPVPVCRHAKALSRHKRFGIAGHEVPPCSRPVSATVRQCGIVQPDPPCAWRLEHRDDG